jgi:hypothetical protein
MGTIIRDTFTFVSSGGQPSPQYLADIHTGPPDTPAHTPDVNITGNVYQDVNFIPALGIVSGSGVAKAVNVHATGTEVQANTINIPVPGNNDGVFTIDVNVPTPAGKMAAGLIFRLANGTLEDYWVIDIENTTGGAAAYEVHVKKFTNHGVGVGDDHLVSSGNTWANSTHNIGVTLDGNTITPQIDGVNQTAIVDGTYSTGQGGGPFTLNDGTFVNTGLDNYLASTNPLVILTTSLPGGGLGIAYSQTITSKGGYQPTVAYSIGSGALPPGLSINSSTGVISGTPSTGGTFTFTVHAADSLANTADQALSIVITGSSTSIYALRPDADASDATRRFQQNVANILNGLGYSGAIVATAGGGFTIGTAATQLKVGDNTALPGTDNGTLIGSAAPVAAPKPGGVLYVSGTNRLSNAIDFTYTPATGLVSMGQMVTGTLFATTAIDLVTDTSGATKVFTITYFAGTTGFLTQLTTYSDTTQDGVQVAPFSGDDALVVLTGVAGPTAPGLGARDAALNLLFGSGPTNADALFAGRQGNTNPALHVNASTANCVTGINITAKAAGFGVTIAATSTGGTESLALDAKGAGSLSLGTVSTGSLVLGNSSNAGTSINSGGNFGVSPGGGSGGLWKLNNGDLQIGANPPSSAFYVDGSTNAPNVHAGIKITGVNAGAGVPVVVTSSGTDESLTIDAKGAGTITLNNTATGKVVLRGTGTNDNAASGFVGEEIESLIAIGSEVNLTSPTPSNVTSISLTKGDWDVQGNVNYDAAGATDTLMSAGISTTSATVPTDGSECYSGFQFVTTTFKDSITLPRKRISIASTTTVYLVGQATFSAGTMKVFGGITARRVR